MKPELARPGKLAHTGSQAEEIGSRDRGSKIGDGESYIVDSRGVETENVAIGRRAGAVYCWRRSDEVVQGAPGIVGELGEERLGFFFGQGTHDEEGEEGRSRGEVRKVEEQYCIDPRRLKMLASTKSWHSKRAAA